MLDEERNIVELEEIFNKDRKVIVFRFTHLNCNICFKSVIEITEKIKLRNRISYDIIVIASLRDFRQFKIFTSQLKRKSCKYYFTNEYFCKELEEQLASPYFCQLNADLEIHDLYIPKNYDYSGINNYFEKVK